MSDTVGTLQVCNDHIHSRASGMYIPVEYSGTCVICQIESLQAENAELKKPDCVWIDEDGYWATGCGLLWNFEDGGPVENEVSFCFGCGGKVAIGEQGE